MLGNFSFGDYFKEKAVVFAWELLTEGYGLDPERLWVSVYTEDDEAARLWESEVGVRPSASCAWARRRTSGPWATPAPAAPARRSTSTRARSMGCGAADCAVGCDCDRYLELWNLVFMQYERDASGKMTPLPKPSIDTGMGLERIAATVQGFTSNYDSDLFTPIMDFTSELAGVTRGVDAESDVSLRVIADHARACAVLVGDGVMPSNEGRGYVLRRILRRAARHGRKLGLDRALPAQGGRRGHGASSRTPTPGLYGNRAFVDKVISGEEERFGETLDTGLKLFPRQWPMPRPRARTPWPARWPSSSTTPTASPWT